MVLPSAASSSLARGQFNGRLVVSGSLDMIIKVWDVETGLCVHTLHGVCLSSVLPALEHSTAAWWGRGRRVVAGHQSLTGLMQLRGKILVSGNADATLRVWDITTGQCVAERVCRRPTLVLTLAGRCLHSLRGHRSAVTNLSFDDKFIVSCSDDGTVKLWDLASGRFLRNLLDLNTPAAGAGDDPGADPNKYILYCPWLGCPATARVACLLTRPLLQPAGRVAHSVLRHEAGVRGGQPRTLVEQHAHRRPRFLPKAHLCAPDAVIMACAAFSALFAPV